MAVVLFQTQVAYSIALSDQGAKHLKNTADPTRSKLLASLMPHAPYLKFSLPCRPLGPGPLRSRPLAAMGKCKNAFTRRVAENRRASVKKTSAGGAPKATDASLASLTAISFAFIEHVLMPPYLAALRRRNCEVKGREMWEVLDKEAGKWQGRAFEALSALDDCAAQSLARVRRRRLVLVSPE